MPIFLTFPSEYEELMGNPLVSNPERVALYSFLKKRPVRETTIYLLTRGPAFGIRSPLSRAEVKMVLRKAVHRVEKRLL